jgi:LysM repeat protein
LDSVPYRESSGDTLTRIAKVHGTTVKALKSANGLEGDRLVVGEKLKYMKLSRQWVQSGVP